MKACITAKFNPDEIPDLKFVNKVYTHDLKQLVGLAELEVDLTTKTKESEVFARNWEYITGWSESARYKIIEEDIARLFLNALVETEHGVFEWIRTRW